MDTSFEGGSNWATDGGGWDGDSPYTGYDALTNDNPTDNHPDMLDDLPEIAAQPDSVSELSPPQQELERRLGEIAVLHSVTAGESEHLYNADGSVDRARGGVVSRTDGEPFEGVYVVETAAGGGNYSDAHSTANSVEISRPLVEIKEVISAQLPLGQDAELQWGKIATEFLDRAEQSVEAERPRLLIAAALTSQFAEDRGERIRFLRAVYGRGLASAMAAACEGSSLVLLTDGPNSRTGNPNAYGPNIVHPVSHLAEIFRVEEWRLVRYLDHIDPASSAQESTAPPVPETYRAVLSELRETGETSQVTQMRAMEASLGAPNVKGIMLDPHKIERFAVEELFIEAQAKALFGGSDVARSPLAEELARLRPTSDGSVIIEPHAGRILQEVPALLEELSRLRKDAQEAIQNLSDPIIDRFSLEEVDASDPTTLAHEQRINLWCKKLLAHTQQYLAIGKYLDFKEFEDEIFDVAIPDDAEGNVWDGSDNGGAAPLIAEEAIAVILGAALQSDAPSATETQLAELTHRNRKKLVLIAKNNLQDSVATQLRDARLTIVNDELELTLESAVPPHGSRGQYSATTVECPALKVGLTNKTPALQRSIYGSNNFIDRLLAIIINEAHARGLFNLEDFRPVQ